MSFDIIDAGDAGSTQTIRYTLESDKNVCKNCDNGRDRCDDIIDPSINLWNLDHVYKNSSGDTCYAPGPLETWWDRNLTDPVTNLPANGESVTTVRDEMNRQRQNAMLRKRIIEYFKSMCGWVPVMEIVRDPDAVVDRGEDGTFNLTFEGVYFDNIHLGSMNTDQLSQTLKFMKFTRVLNPDFKMDVWMPLFHEIEKLSEAYHLFLDQNLEGVKVRFGFEDGKPFVRLNKQ